MSVLQTGSILVVDDDPGALTLLSTLLRKEGYDVVSASDGAQAMALLETRHFDLLVTDLQMPSIGGKELLEQVKTSARDTDVLLVSAVGSIPIAVETIKLGARDFIEKPFDLQTVRDKVASVFEARNNRMRGVSRPEEPTVEQFVQPVENAEIIDTLPPPRAIGRPQQLGRYKLGSKLGVGGMGEVFEAYDPNLRRGVAIKLLREHSVPEHRHEALVRFQREGWVGGKLAHPHIATVYDFGEDADGDCLYLVMELVEGPSLRKILAYEGKLPIARACAIALQTTEALVYAHQHGVVHRDIKPENIVVAPGDQVKVVDFGIAKLNQNEMTADGRVLGSPKYLSPEMAGGTAVDYRADQFSLGTVLVEMITGAQIFKGETVFETLGRVRGLATPTFKQLGVTVPKDLQKLVLRLLEKDPEKRFSDETQMLAKLQAITTKLRARA